MLVKLNIPWKNNASEEKSLKQQKKSVKSAPELPTCMQNENDNILKRF